MLEMDTDRGYLSQSPYLLNCCCLVDKSCLTFCDPLDCNMVDFLLSSRNTTCQLLQELNETIHDT